MTKAELQKQLQEQNEIIDKQKKRIKRQNEKAKEKWDTISCRLPKGTRKRITDKGLTVNGFINALVLKELDKIETNKWLQLFIDLITN